MTETVIQNIGKLTEYGAIGIVLAFFLVGTAWAVAKLVNRLLPAMEKWFDSHAKLAKVCADELPKLREVGENSTEAIRQCTSAVEKCTQLVETTAKNTAVVGREHREARDAATRRDREIITKLESIECHARKDKGDE